MMALNRFNSKEEIDTNIEKYLTFIIDGRYYAYPIRDVKEIIEMQDITEVPEFPSYAKGIINLRNIVIPVIDVRLRFNKPEHEYNAHTCIIVLIINSTEIGFIVDTVDEVLDIEKSSISPPPLVGSEGHARYIDGVGKLGDKIVLLLNSEKMLSDDDLEMLASFAQ